MSAYSVLTRLSAIQICELRLKCVEVFVLVASKADIEKDKIFEIGEKLFQHCIKALGEKYQEDLITKAPDNK